MAERLKQQRRVEDEILLYVNSCEKGKICRFSALIVPSEEAPANSVPAAAVIRRVQALIGITGRKAHAGGLLSQM